MEVTEQVPGLEPNEGYALRIKHRGIQMHVLDPASCLRAKVDVLGREMAVNVRGDRKDAGHVRLLLRVVPEYLAEVVRRNSGLIDADGEQARSLVPIEEAGRLLKTYAKGVSHAKWKFGNE